MKQPILLATTNLGKLKEIQDLMIQSGLEELYTLLTLKDFPDLEDIPETETSFLGNALLKARAYFKATNYPVIADDSGLVIPSLNGEPGVYSARYAGENKNFQENIQLVLSKMENITVKSAYFASCIIFLTAENLYTVSEGFCHGEITHHISGQHGFGYDPIFYLPSYQQTMADITLEEKQKISHRGKALRQLIPLLKLYGKA